MLEIFNDVGAVQRFIRLHRAACRIAQRHEGELSFWRNLIF